MAIEGGLKGFLGGALDKVNEAKNGAISLKDKAKKKLQDDLNVDPDLVDEKPMPKYGEGGIGKYAKDAVDTFSNRTGRMVKKAMSKDKE